MTNISGILNTQRYNPLKEDHPVYVPQPQNNLIMSLRKDMFEDFSMTNASGISNTQRYPSTSNTPLREDHPFYAPPKNKPPVGIDSLFKKLSDKSDPLHPIFSNLPMRQILA